MAYQIILSGITPEKQSLLFGSFDCNTHLIEEKFGVIITSKTNGIVISGDESNVKCAETVVQKLLYLCKDDEPLNEQNVRYVIDMVWDGEEKDLDGLDNDCICISSRGKPVKAKTVGQKNYVEAIKNNTVTLGIGPAGTGKTFLAVAMAVNALRLKQVNRIILTRPAVEAGERLGFLPGDLQSKIDPYLRPLYDSLHELLGVEGFARNLERGVIEIAPLAYMRGRTLDNAYIILDEAQNTTPAQMKMFLTRIGFGSKVIITGDLSQKDLPKDVTSGLDVALKVLAGIEDIGIVKLSSKDVVRHPLVQKIVDAYDKYESVKPTPAKQYKGRKRTNDNNS